MNIEGEHFRFRVAGLAPIRLAWMFIAASGGAVFFQGATPCQASGALSLCGMFLASCAALSALFVPRSQGARSRALFGALAGIIINMCSVH